MVDFILSLDSVSKNFGGLQAVVDATFDVRAGMILSVIGPNGAGKTTLFNLISGLYRDYKGQIHFDGRAIARCRPDEIAKAGVGRTFQNVRLFKNMTVLENVMVGTNGWMTPGFFKTVFGFRGLRRQERTSREFAREMLELVGLADLGEHEAESLPLGKQKLIEIARAMSVKPKLLLLDEPGAGLNDAEMEELKRIILKIRNAGITQMLVEHNMKFVMGISDEVVVLNFGVKIAAGSPAEIVKNEQVMEAYLGRGQGLA
jgi:branched-chain amino acid transport system ATP-binding protein